MSAKPKNELVAFRYAGIDVTKSPDGFINVTKMWEAIGRPHNREPKNWRRKEGAEFIDSLAKELKVPSSHLLVATRGRYGGTFAHWQVALAYAKYLSPDFHRFVNSAFREWAEEEANPELKHERAVERRISGYRKAGMSDGWISERLNGLTERKLLTRTLADHNCKAGPRDNAFADITRAISLGVTGQTPREIKSSKGLPAAARTRDHMDERQLAGTRFLETMSRVEIQDRAAEGNAECVAACRAVVDAFRPVFASHRAKMLSAG